MVTAAIKNLPADPIHQSHCCCSGCEQEKNSKAERGFFLIISILIRAVEPDFKKSNKKSDAQGACRRLYPPVGASILVIVMFEMLDVLDG